ncbi:hypothetical protein GMOD_00007511 [Pyrenophora seminiperda CCB06]|uniref:Uncharacterized protein n=1 Tax=Pyrenophora seminiperda CCB06 TaxID=1302712 RepID=A0A3M7MDE0_9PLEO|nr:hypothetical protein GMOD_00007511 [Pyrenophora seminiperda CCB06]
MTSKAPVSPRMNHTSPSEQGGEADINPKRPHEFDIKPKGEMLSMGSTGLVERLDSGDAIKSSWPEPIQSPSR